MNSDRFFVMRHLDGDQWEPADLTPLPADVADDRCAELMWDEPGCLFAVVRVASLDSTTARPT